MRYAVLLCSILATPCRGAAQWHLALLGRATTTHGDAENPADPDHAELRADHLAGWSLELARGAGGWRIGIDVRRTTGDLAEVTSTAAVAVRDVLSAWGSGFEIDRRLAGFAGGAMLVGGLGAGIDRWSFDVAGGGVRWRASARAALEADLPIASGWGAIVRGEVAAGPSLFRASEVPDGFSRHAARRIGVAIGLARGWR